MVQNFETGHQLPTNNWKKHCGYGQLVAKSTWSCRSYYPSSCCLPWHCSGQNQVRTQWKPLESDDSGLDYGLVEISFVNKIFDFMRLGIPSLLKTGTIDTIRVSKRLHSRLLTDFYTCSITCFVSFDTSFRLYALDNMPACWYWLFLFSSMVSWSTLDCFLSFDLPLCFLWLDNLLAPSDSCVDFLSAAFLRLPCRSRTQLDLLMHPGILQILSPVFGNYRVWLDWATALVMKVLVIFRPSSNRLWVGFARKSRCIWTSWARNMLSTKLIIIYSARWFDFGSALRLPFIKITLSTLETQNLNQIMSTTSGTRWRTSLDGGLRRFGIPMMGGFWWPRRKSSICWLWNLLANWTKEFWWKRPLAPRVAWNPKGNHWLQIWAKGLYKLSFIYQKML